MRSADMIFLVPIMTATSFAQTNEEQNSLRQATLEPHSWFEERVATVRKPTLTPHDKWKSPWKFPEHKLLTILMEPTCNFLGQEFQGLR